jgi:leucyl-tRNA synthetase
VQGAARFVQRIWKLVLDSISACALPDVDHVDADALATIRKLAHRATRQVDEDLEGLRLNRAVAQIYELANGLGKFLSQVEAAPSRQAKAALREGVERLVQLVAPMMPHLAETCWRALGREGLVSDAPWPDVDPALLVEESITIPVQVNGKLRASLEAPAGTDRERLEAMALSLEPVARFLDGRAPRKVVVVPDRIVNVVV